MPSPSDTSQHSPDVLIVGAGPAGLSTALWCANLGLSVVVFEQLSTTGGQLHAIPGVISNLPGTVATTGTALSSTLSTQLASAGITVLTERTPRLLPDRLTVECSATNERWSSGAIVIATGARRRHLGVDGEARFTGKGLAYNIGAVSLPSITDARVVIVGGGDDAFEHAHLAAMALARSVTLTHRGETPSARPASLERAISNPKITSRYNYRVKHFVGTDVLTHVVFDTPDGETSLACDLVFVCIGPEPNTRALGLATLPSGYLSVDRWLRTSRPGVFAVGDVCAPWAPTISTAMGHGAQVAKTIAAMLDGRAPWAVTHPLHSDLLCIRGLSFAARIGVYPRERKHKQTLGFDLCFELDASTSAPTDDVRATIDYAAVSEAIAEVLSRQHFNLIETVAETVTEALRARFSVRWIQVKVIKPGVPQARAEASLTVERGRRTVATHGCCDRWDQR